jgi:hypothetical protein
MAHRKTFFIDDLYVNRAMGIGLAPGAYAIKKIRDIPRRVGSQGRLQRAAEVTICAGDQNEVS